MIAKPEFWRKSKKFLEAGCWLCSVKGWLGGVSGDWGWGTGGVAPEGGRADPRSVVCTLAHNILQALEQHVLALLTQALGGRLGFVALHGERPLPAHPALANHAVDVTQLLEKKMEVWFRQLQLTVYSNIKQILT